MAETMQQEKKLGEAVAIPTSNVQTPEMHGDTLQDVKNQCGLLPGQSFKFQESLTTDGQKTEWLVAFIKDKRVSIHQDTLSCIKSNKDRDGVELKTTDKRFALRYTGKLANGGESYMIVILSAETASKPVFTL